MQKLIKEIHSLKNLKKIEIYKNFHKTNLNGYAHGEEFLGLTVPQMSILARKYFNISLDEIDKMLDSNIHEEKYVAVIILANKYENSEDKKQIVNFFLKNTKRISGWDLVDSTAYQILGNYLIDKEKDVLYKLAKSDNLWERRIAIVSTYYFIKNNFFDETLKIAKILLHDKHDLIHKAVGWMLREVGKKNIEILKKFLKDNYKNMPRTMLRYSIERFPEKERKGYLKGEM